VVENAGAKNAGPDAGGGVEIIGVENATYTHGDMDEPLPYNSLRKSSTPAVLD